MGTPNSAVQPLQKIQNFAERLVLLTPRHHHSTPLLEKLHWLPISERIKYKVACMCLNAINGSAPAYLSELLHVYTPYNALCRFFFGGTVLCMCIECRIWVGVCHVCAQGVDARMINAHYYYHY